MTDGDPIPYEPLSNLTTHGQVRFANRIVSEGWRSGDNSPLKLERPFKWPDASVPRSHAFHIHKWEMLDALLLAHRQTGNVKFIRPAIEVAVDWVENFSIGSVDLDTPPESEMVWYDMAVGIRAHRLAYVLDVAERQDLASKSEQGALWQSLLRHAEYLSDDAQIKFHNNHGFYQVAGQLAMARRFADRSEEMSSAYVQARERLSRMLKEHFTPDGIHKEHSPDYHRMMSETLGGLVDAGLIDDAVEKDFVERIERALSWFVLPNGHIANFGDSDFRKMTRGPSSARSKWRTDEMLYVASEGEIGDRPENMVAEFAEGGYAVGRIPSEDHPGDGTQDSYLAQIAAFHSRAHKHADTLSFLWSDRGSDILVDAGRYGYIGKTVAGSELHRRGFWYTDPFRNYCETTKAHNCLEFDGEDYPRKFRDPFGSAIESAEYVDDQDVAVFVAHAPHEKRLSHRRILVFKPRQWLLCFDHFEDLDGQERAATQWFHFAPGTGCETSDGVLTAVVPQIDEPLQMITLLPGSAIGSPVEGQTEPAYQGWWSRAAREIVPNPAVPVHLEDKSATGALATVFTFSEHAKPLRSKVRHARNSARFDWYADGRYWRLRLSPAKSGKVSVKLRASRSKLGHLLG